jgi:hypothetical protein
MFYKIEKFSLWGQDDSECLFFPQTRYAIKLIIDVIGENNKRPVKILLPSFYCWEVAVQFGDSNVEFTYYNIDDNFQPCVNSLDKIERSQKNYDVFISVDYFGIPSNYDKIRSFCKNNNLIYFIDQTHCVFPGTYPQNGKEFLFVSPYKQFAIPEGAMLWMYKSEVGDFVLYNRIISSYSGLLFRKKSTLKQSIWLIKSFLVKLTNRIVYTLNIYEDVESHEKANQLNNYSKGISFVSYRQLQSYESREVIIQNQLVEQVQFYNKVVEMINNYFPCKSINSAKLNSHLFGIEFSDGISAEKVHFILMRLKLPVMTWPEKKYIRFLNDDSLISEVKLKVEKLVFLGVFFENSCLKENQQIKILKLLENACKTL